MACAAASSSGTARQAHNSMSGQIAVMVLHSTVQQDAQEAMPPQRHNVGWSGGFSD